ncbi:MAG: autotransporter outer membrane beta-barrel domain-containing protein [Deltaproteobacteria bacterium]|jgi:hypothetical protein|nr:autotransporter outer membrane beta-barrel domain-containing protein [Deltaproteobacteria bacterium]
MRKRFLLSLAMGLVLGLSGTALANKSPERRKAMRDLSYEAQAQRAWSSPAAGDGEKKSSWVFIPEFHFSHHGNLKTTLNGSALKSDSGHSTVGSFTVIASKPFTDWFTLSFMYQYGYSNYDGGLLTPDIDGFGGSSDIDVTAHLMGFVSNFEFPTVGKIEFSLLMVWDIYDGAETIVYPGGATETRSVDQFDDRLISFLVWWDKDFPLAESWTIDPYLGWRSVHVVLKDMNDWQGAPGDYYSDSAWTHLLSGGVKLKYGAFPWGFTARVGANRRVTKNDVPGYASRAQAPGVVNLGWMTSWDRTVVSWGAGVSYVAPDVAVVELGYNGAAGADTNYHTLSLTLVVPF